MKVETQGAGGADAARLLFSCSIILAALGGVGTAGLACDSCHCHQHNHPHNEDGKSNNHQHGSTTVAATNVANSAAAPIRIAVVGDTQNGEFGGGVLDELVRDIDSLDPDFVIFPGDLVGDTGVGGWQAWKDRTAALGANALGIDKRLMTPGNHDRGSGGTFTNWQQTFDWLPDNEEVGGAVGVDRVDYFIDYQGVRIVSISSDAPGQIYNARHVNHAPPALDWLREVVKDADAKNADTHLADNISHLLTFSHRPVTTQAESPSGGTNGEWWRSMTGQDSESGQTVATAFLPGHWHMYQPSRPDPDVDTMEIISGTGGGGLEGAPHRNHHGFSLLTIDGADVTSQFFGDPDGSTNGWNFTSVLDTIVVSQGGGLPVGELANYKFDAADPTLDASVSSLSKQHPLNFSSGAISFADAVKGDVLDLTASGAFADARSIGDNNLAVLRDITIKVDAKLQEPSANEVNTLVAFGGALGSFNGSLNNQESSNYAYQFAITLSQTLQFSWQHDDGTWESISSTATISDLDQWHSYRVERDADAMAVAFYVDNSQLGDTVGIQSLPTGGGSGSLYIGANASAADTFDGWLDDVVIDSTGVELTPVVVGDLDGDGSLGSNDWLLFAAGLGSRVPGLTDFTGDGVTNYEDFIAFRDLFDAANGNRAFSALTTVPEPATLYASAVLTVVWQLCRV